MFEFIKKVFSTGLTILSSVNLLSATPLNAIPFKCVSMTNQEYKLRSQIVNVNSYEPLFYPISIKTSKCSGNCNNINNPYANICVPGVVKILDVKVFNLMSRPNESRHIEWHETWKCKCRLDTTTGHNKQRWNNNKCRCECKELIDKGICDKRLIQNPSNCECECDKSCDVGEYLDYENCKCMKKLVDKLIEECTETVEEVKIAQITLAQDKNKHKYSSCTLYIVSFSILVTINAGIGTYFVYFLWFFKEDVTRVKFGTRTQAKI